MTDPLNRLLDIGDAIAKGVRGNAGPTELNALLWQMDLTGIAASETVIRLSRAGVNMRPMLAQLHARTVEARAVIDMHSSLAKYPTATR